MSPFGARGTVGAGSRTVSAMVSILAGLGVLAAVVVDVFNTVFVPRGGAGWLTSRSYRAIWAAWSAIACAGGHRRRRLLALAGPALLPLTVVLWVAEVVAGFTLIYLPVSEHFVVPNGDETSGAFSALYVSGYAATTLGVGDIYASTEELRLLVTLEAAAGFALFSISITYVLSVYGALQRATGLSLSISRFVGRGSGEDPIDLVCRAVCTSSEADVLVWLSRTMDELAVTDQAQRQYPLIAYFHVPDDDRALPLALSDVLTLVTVCRGLLDPEEYPTLSSGPTIVGAWSAVTTFVGDHGRELTGSGDESDDRRGDRLYADARTRLSRAGVSLREDAAARALFLGLYQEWSAEERALVRHFRYERSERASTT